jgi:hypothetical protein
MGSERQGGGGKYDKRTEETENEDTGDEETTLGRAEDRRNMRVWAEPQGQPEHTGSDPSLAPDCETKRKGDDRESNLKREQKEWDFRLVVAIAR